MPHRILVADDESDIRNLTKIILENNGYQVSLATNGVEALQKAQDELPDLILLDVVMPDKSGWEVCKILKSKGKTKHIPIIISTVLSVTFGNNERYAEEARANAYLPKPFNKEELLTKIKKYLD